MIPRPSVVTPELADAALNCVPLARARKLAEWIGASRPLTGSGVLKPALATEACRALGIELPPGRLRTALDLDELMQDWDVACYAGYIIPKGSRVRATWRLTDTSPSALLQSWLNAVSAELGLPYEPCTGCLTVLHELSTADGPLDLPRLAEAARSPAAAVRELLAYAESVDPRQRMIAMALAIGIGPEGAPAWREWADRPGFGAYARMWLTEQGEEVPEHPGDQAWLTVEAFSAADAAISLELTPLVLGAALADAGQAAETLSLMRDSGHPDAARFVQSVATVTGIQPSAVRPARPVVPAGEVYQLKITLRGLSKPPVWRRVAVPAALTLDLLHEVIQHVMGWQDGHMHVFSTPVKDYGVPDSVLGYADESTVTLAELLVLPRATMRYTYDFGDDWEHDIVLEKVLPPAPAASVSCLAGKGACPPEDCGGAWGYASLKEVLANPDHEEHEDLLDWLGLDSAADFDPARFSLDEVNVGLARLL